MTSKITKTTKRTAATPSTEKKKPTQRPSNVKGDEGAPIEHYHGEPTDKRTGDAGDLDEETLDRNAPYNRTYGLKDE